MRDEGGANNWGEVKKLTASDADADDGFGHYIAVSGDIAVVGARNNDDAGTDSGSAYVFARDLGGPDNWGEVKKLTASDAAASQLFGVSVAVSGDIAVVGAPRNDDACPRDPDCNSGSAYVFCNISPFVCPADTDGSSVVDVVDLVNVILAWGSADPAADVNADGIVDVQDLIEVVLNWGPCA